MARNWRRVLMAGCVFGVTAIAAAPAMAIDEEHYRKGRELIEKAIGYLRTQQDAETGGWSVNPEGPQFPAITGLVINGMVMEPRIDMRDESVRRGVAFMLKYRQPDGGIYDRVLPSYNTAICVSALSRVSAKEAGEAVEAAVPFLKSLQWGEDAGSGAAEGADVSGTVGPEHPYYGGVGYGKSGRPDNSNLNLMLQALHDAGVSCDDPAFQRALVFLSRTQMLDEVNDMPYADGSKQGGFIYATSLDRQQVGSGESKTNMIEETLDDGTKVSRLRAYGSMTYAGFKSYVYANLSRDDPRVQAAYGWIRANYTLEENPGIGREGYYYYLLMFSRALDAWGLPQIEVAPRSGEGGVVPATNAEGMEVRDWANDLVDRLAELQEPDGSFRVLDKRWMEDNKVLITAYALLALQHAVE